MLCIFLLRDVFESLTCCLYLWLSSLLNCNHFCVFPLFEKPVFIKLNRSRQIAIYRDPWTSFLNRSYLIFDPSNLSGICLNSFLTDSRSIEKVSIQPIASRQLFDPSRYFCRRQILNRYICRELVLDRSLIHRDTFSLNSFSVKIIFISLILSRQICVFSPPKHFFLSLNLKPTWISA